MWHIYHFRCPWTWSVKCHNSFSVTLTHNKNKTRIGLSSPHQTEKHIQCTLRTMHTDFLLCWVSLWLDTGQFIHIFQDSGKLNLNLINSYNHVSVSDVNMKNMSGWVVTMMSNDRHDVSNYRSKECLFNSLFRLTTKKHKKNICYCPFVRGIQWRPVVSPQKGTVTRKMFPFDDVIMIKRICKNDNLIITK